MSALPAAEVQYVIHLSNHLAATQDCLLLLSTTAALRPHCQLADHYLDQLDRHIKRAVDDLSYLITALRGDDDLIPSGISPQLFWVT
jgi:hypothetical protein